MPTLFNEISIPPNDGQTKIEWINLDNYVKMPTKNKQDECLRQTETGTVTVDISYSHIKNEVNKKNLRYFCRTFTKNLIYALSHKVFK